MIRNPINMWKKNNTNDTGYIPYNAIITREQVNKVKNAVENYNKKTHSIPFYCYMDPLCCVIVDEYMDILECDQLDTTDMTYNSISESLVGKKIETPFLKMTENPVKKIRDGVAEICDILWSSQLLEMMGQ